MLTSIAAVSMDLKAANETKLVGDENNNSSVVSDCNGHQATQVISISPNNLSYRGEGNCNLVVSLQKDYKILRIPKLRQTENVPLENQRKKLALTIKFIREILMVTLNLSPFAECPQLVYLSDNQISLISQAIAGLRPRSRLHKILSPVGSYALYMTDYCALTSSQATTVKINGKPYRLCGSVMSTELKPKQGFLPIRDNLTDDMAIKASISRFCLKQFYKSKLGSVDKQSKYCPLDLFSGCTIRMKRAIRALIKVPQNNLRIFENLDKIYGDNIDELSVGFERFFEPCSPEEVLDSYVSLIVKALLYPTQAELDPAFEDKMASSQWCCLHEASGMECHLCAAGKHSLDRFSVLGHVLSVQKLDTIEAGQAMEYAKYFQQKNGDFIALLSSRVPSLDNVGSSHRCKNEDEDDYRYRKVWEFMVSLTAKDLSVMMIMQRIEAIDELDWSRACDNEGNKIKVVTDDKGVTYACSISVTDLDPKCPSSFEELDKKWFQKDLKIVKAYTELSS
ncbi:Inositol-pentakisphosphate 2-kinase [Halotydeus destructor]|nr:Inositol-pentakisphosphate 2-kinase [Halotydeus destructor]